MGEFCLKCWNEINKTNFEKNKFKLSKELELCEGCGKLKHIIISERTKFRNIYFFPF